MKTIKKKIPKFKTVDAEIDFWDKNDATDFYDFGKAQSVRFSKFIIKDHKDPFDLFLIYLSITENYILITKDSYISKLKLKGFKTIWWNSKWINICKFYIVKKLPLWLSLKYKGS